MWRKVFIENVTTEYYSTRITYIKTSTTHLSVDGEKIISSLYTSYYKNLQADSLKQNIYKAYYEVTYK